jgi:TPR repeat protein
MLNYAQSNDAHKGMGVLIVADDLEREYGNEEKAASMREEIQKEGWLGVSMRDDWATIYGEGVEKDPEQAVLWYTKSAEQGNAKGQTNLGHCYSNGIGVEQDLEKAAYWTRKAAEQGLARAQNNLGDYYENGKGVEQSYEQAFYWYEKAAKQGDKYAQHSVGVLYRDGKGVKQDNENAIWWLKMAIRNGKSEAVEDLKKCQGLQFEQDWYYGGLN